MGTQVVDLNNSLPAPTTDPRVINRAEYTTAIRNPYFREHLRLLSINEDDENSYYTGMLDTLAEHTLGACPMIWGSHPINIVNDAVEDTWGLWAELHGMGGIFRGIRRDACKFGLGLAVPYAPDDDSDILGLRYRSVSPLQLQSPQGSSLEDRIHNGIEYDKNWDIKKVYVGNEDSLDPTVYDIQDVLLWHSPKIKPPYFLPECGSAFCLFPSIRRYMEAIVDAEEFRATMPLAVELDPAVYRVEDAPKKGVPTGSYKHQKGRVPTLPPGAKLSGIPSSLPAGERAQFITLVISAAARCLRMPKNIAMGDSSGHNMATAQIDVQPWNTSCKIGRHDFQPVIRKAFDAWHKRAILVTGYLPAQARNDFQYEIGYDATFEHPDPGKRANARATDLASGSTTLHEIWTDKGKNPRRQLEREAQTLGLSVDEYREILVSIRAKAPFLLQEQEETVEERESNGEDLDD